MRASFVLRLDSDLLRAGEFSGDVEEVRSGRRRAIHGVGDLVDFCRQAGREEVGVAVQNDVPSTLG